MNIQEAIEKISKIQPNELLRKELGTALSFEVCATELTAVHRALYNTLQLAEKNQDFTEILNTIETIYDSFSNIVREIGALESPPPNATKQLFDSAQTIRSAIIARIRDLYITNFNTTHPNTLLSLYEKLVLLTDYQILKGETEWNINTAIKDFKDAAAETLNKQSTEFNSKIEAQKLAFEQLIKDKETEFHQKAGEQERLLAELKEKGSEKILRDYAEIFGAEAKKHSHVTWTKKIPWLSLGASQRWLVAVIALVIALAYCFLWLEKKFPVYEIINLPPHQPYDRVNIAHIIIKLTFVSISIILLTFMLRQFLINKHLATLNNHRQNALNSYQLFADVSSSEKDTRNALLLQLSKTIYEQGRSGYLSDKNIKTDSTSVLELFKLMQKDSPQ